MRENGIIGALVTMRERERERERESEGWGGQRGWSLGSQKSPRD